MSWDYDKSLRRIRHHLDTMGTIEVSKLNRAANLEELLRETVCREINGAHVYVVVSNFTRLASIGNSTQGEYKRLIQAVHLYQRAVTQLVELFGGECIHFQGAKLHALFYRPRRSRPFNRGGYRERQLTIQAVLFEFALKDFVQSIFNPVFPGFGDFTIAGGADMGTAIGTRDGIKGDQELLFLGAPANHAAKIIGSANSLRLTHHIYAALPSDLRKRCAPVGQDLYQLEPVIGTTLDKLLKDYAIPWKRDDIAKGLEDEKRQFPLNKIVYSSAEAPLDLDNLSISNNKRVLAASLFADVSGFTRYIDAARTARKRRRALRVFHAIRKEMALVIKDDFQGLRIQYQGDRVQGLFHLPKDNEAAIAEKAVKAAIGLQSSMQQTLKACLPEMNELQLKVGIDLGITLVSRLGIRGERDRICLGESVERAALCEERSEGTQIGITKRVLDVLPVELRKYFVYKEKAQCYIASLVYKG